MPLPDPPPVHLLSVGPQSRDTRRALGRFGLRFHDPSLERSYLALLQQNGRFHNRYALLILVAIVDLFFLPELKEAPEIVHLSSILRFAVLTPLSLLFVLADWQGLLGRAYGTLLVLLCLMPTAFVALEIINTTSATALPNLQAAPLILLVIINGRFTVRQSAVIVTGSSLAYIGAITHSPAVPIVFLPSMILTSLAISVGLFAFTVRIDLRERTVYWLNLQAEGRNRILAQLVQMDALTGVPNRRCFDETLDLAWSTALSQGRALGLIMIDVDHFKKYNDHYGHQQGDACLQQVAQAARCAIRDGDLIARYGGEEFAVILDGADLAAVLRAAERILGCVAGLQMPHEGLSPPGFVTVSLGAASVTPRADMEARALVEAADQQLYLAKRGGRNRVASAA